MIENATKLEIYQAIEAARGLECLPMFTIYDRPSDYPDGFIARMFLTGRLDIATLITVTGSLEDIQDKMMEVGLSKLTRSEGDDPKIVEVWL
jgi:hypothetical protein